MILKNKLQLKTIENGGIAFRFFSTGDIFDIVYDNDQINLVDGNAIDGSLMNVYLRIKEDNQYVSTPLIGVRSPSVVRFVDHQVIYEGIFRDIRYQLYLVIGQFQWDIHVRLTSKKSQKVELFYGQDVAIQTRASVLSSEAYTVQYIDYKVYDDPQGYVLSAKQNQGRAQYLQIGSYKPNIAYSTDGFQFFGLPYKATGKPSILSEKRLVSRLYQYEFSYLALQSHMIEVNHKTTTYGFYGYYVPDVTHRPYPIMTIKPLTYQLIDSLHIEAQQPLSYPLLNGLDLSEEEIKTHFPDMRHVEKENQNVLSFFTSNHHHTVMKQKELLVDRPHGHLMVHGDLLHATKHVMSTTNFMFGVFNSHTSLGNSSFNKFSGDLRNPLNIQKVSGQRIYVKLNNQYHILSIPSYYEMGGATTRWYYQLEDDAIIVDSYVDMDHLTQVLEIYSTTHKAYDMIISTQVLMDNQEYSGDVIFEEDNQRLIFHTKEHTLAHDKNPNLTFCINKEDATIINEEDFFNISNQHGILLLSYAHKTHIKYELSASFSKIKSSNINYEEADIKGTSYYESLLSHFHLFHEQEQEKIDRINDLLFWYTHNATVHYASPHGLEQYNGAAWGTRDVCQGPVELFMSAQRFDIVREILIKVYQRQFLNNGDFPQWFMYDEYYQIQPHESHGDIVIWPLRALAYYLKATKDLFILDKVIPYMNLDINDFDAPDTLMNHVNKQINTIKSSFIKGTSLPKYGGGDWDDTLQPANHDLTYKMVSGWTVALLYESIQLFSEEIMMYDQMKANELKTLAINIKEDYEHYLIVDHIPAGFIVFEDNHLDYLLHPKDNKTGLKYRLLPFVRSMISEMALPQDINNYLKTIDRYLMHPDGVRLMDTAVNYQDGNKTFFQRAETAANFGREIGLQYVHAHIRYIEAMTKINQPDRAYEAIYMIMPILIEQTVKHAQRRQSNMYFSSSDAAFHDRYQAKQEFEKLRQGEVQVKGGWRLYSSGPGILIHQIISHFLGISILHEDLLLEPSIPKSLDQLTCTYHYYDKQITIIYDKHIVGIKINDVPIDGHETLNIYGKKIYTISKAILEAEQAPIEIRIGI